ncbi:primosomal protein N' [Borrelia miyamotoi]|uniref:Replication restart protein PriA n=1 Tax=Borrelia miyamotoi TaxID=47466 RepID=A0AAX3JMQ5_9SPIR|nr:primosomal protein N' [Borrelia miyamotoi]QFP42274.1 primosomal protein N' [Borrelia miyamotoi]QFP48387.1 primosomal protein N' [Borrelia miyamotoi]QGT56148.1 primosomal protein N' [Borrelia miyamotoi]QGT56928.1 primosomal protein N' [Borrelia miyamotoi]WAZ72192.1 primosomal protein N' [Borrelia miyamotoi]
MDNGLKCNFYYYEIAFNIPLNRLFLYKYKEKLKIGIRVITNFNGKDKIGIIIKRHTKEELNEDFKFEIKNILKVIDENEIIIDHNINLAHWISKKTFSGFGEALFCGLPKALSSNKRINNDNKNKNENLDSKIPIQLNEEQNKIYKDIIVSNIQNTFYLFGIPGSGKTEIFIKLCENYLEQKKQIIFLIPEISLGHQIVKRIKITLGTNKVYEYNSKVSKSKKVLIWNKVKNGENLIIIGIKSALMLPFKNLGLIVMDEEHEYTYKSENTPRFHSRHIGFFLQSTFNAKFVMGSATPSLEAYLAMENNQIKKIVLNNKFFKKTFKELKIIDMKKERQIISSELLYSIQKSLIDKRQALIFINKRGYSKTIECNTCEYVICCPNCSFNLTYHKSENKLICHYCNHKTNIINNCPDCNSQDIAYKAYGIQFIEKELKKFLPNARIARTDSDINNKEIIKSINEFENGQLDILIGTQIIAKGFNFKQIKTLGIINADIGMGLPDFRSSERIFAIISQVLGRAARFQSDNTIIIQTKNPDYYAIKYAYEGKYEEFYQEEIKIRKELNYPPFKKIIRIVVRSHKEESAKHKCLEFFEISKKSLNEEIEYFGPSKAPMSKISKYYRYNIIYLSKSFNLLEKLIQNTKEKVKSTRDTYIEIDYYPISLI